jgi:hypothetical protein
MRYIDLRQALKDFTVFSLRDIRSVDEGFHRRRLNEWQDKGYIRKVINGYYVFSDLDLKEDALFEIANRIYPPSYVSLQTALAYYRMIPETVYTITSVSTRRTYSFSTPLGEFAYRTVQPSLYNGYRLVQKGDRTFKLASPVKALLDYLYLHPGIKTEDDFSSLRLDADTFFEMIAEDEFIGPLKKYGLKSLESRAMKLWEFLAAERMARVNA